MTRIFALLVLLPGTALAQASNFPTDIPDDIDPSIFIGAPLLSNEDKYELTKAPRFQFQPTPYVVIGDDAVKPADSWTKADDAACAASGGEVLPLPAGRTMCFRF
jgi:hypothetical protein